MRTERSLHRHLLAAAALLLCASSAVASPIDERRPADKNVRITVKNINGSVTIEGWDREEVAITGELGEDVEKLDVSGTASRLRIEVVYPDGKHNFGHDSDTDLIIKMPAGGEARVGVVNADIDVSGMRGAIEVESVNGDLTVASECEAISAHTVNGRIEVTAPAKNTEIETVGGRIILDGLQGEVSVNTVGGTIMVKGGEFSDARFNSVSGDVEFTGSLADEGTFRFESHNGDIVLNLPAKTSADFEVTTFNGDILNELGPPARKSSNYGPGRELNFTAGSGDARVTISTFNGDIHIVKK
jgi:DUF4097 and DUF4098 domain-containing protein YvlB